MDFCECGSIKIKGKCSNNHCRQKNDKCKEWVTGGRSTSFIKPVTYEEASNFVEKKKNEEKKFLK